MRRVGIGRRRHQHEFGTQRPQRVLFFAALRFRHHDDGAIAARAADNGETDAGVAGRALDDDTAGFEHPPCLGILDDAECGAILHTAAGIEKLGLAEDRRTGSRTRPFQLDQRRIADQRDDIGCNHGIDLIPWRRTGKEALVSDPRWRL